MIARNLEGNRPTVELAPLELEELRSLARRRAHKPTDLNASIEVIDTEADAELDQVILLIASPAVAVGAAQARYPRYTRPQPLRWFIRCGAVAAVVASVVALLTA